jgi:hypothetical protein
MRIFISHSTRDRDFVLSRLKPALDAKGCASWCSSSDLKAAANWEQQIRAALAASDWFVVVMSPDAQDSEWVQAETHWAVEHMPGRIVPILARSCRPIDLHLRLGTLQYVDFRAGFDPAFRELLQVIQHYQWGGVGEGQLSESFDETESTRLIQRPRTASLLVHVVRVGTPAYDKELHIQSSATIGRSVKADLHVDDDCVSRRHARIDVVSADRRVGLTVTDLNSANGTFLNGELVLAPQGIRQGDVVAVGNCELHVRRVGEIDSS